MNKIHWFNWCDRIRLTFLVACGALILGSIYPWYKLPPLVMESFKIETLVISNISRILTVFMTIVCIVLIWQRGSHKRIWRIIFWCSLCLALLFPYAIMTWHPKVAFVATTSYSQTSSIIAHIETNFPEVQAQWKQNILLGFASEPPSIFSLQISSIKFFQLASWDKFFVEGLGYSPSFFTLIGHGWSMTIIGLVITLISLYLSIPSSRLNIFLKDISIILPWYTLFISIIVISIISFNITNYQLNVLFAKGKYKEVLEISRSIEILYPPLVGDIEFLRRKAKAGFYSQSPDQSLIYLINGIDYLKSKDFLKAELFFQKSLKLNPNQFLIKAYLTASIVNQGVNDFNNHKSSSAIKHFEKALKVSPGDLGVLYSLMLADTVNGDFQKASTAAKMIIDNQQYFQFPSLSLLGQAYVHLTWNNYQNDDLNEAWKQYRKSIDQKKWEK